MTYNYEFKHKTPASRRARGAATFRVPLARLNPPDPDVELDAGRERPGRVYSLAVRRRDVDDTVELGVELLDALEHEELSLAAAVDRIETVTEEPALTREILETAERRGVIEREGDTVVPTTRNYVSFESDVVSKEGEFTCRRCGAGLSTGHFVRFESGEHGPFGSSCIRKVTGRE